jgi:rod shape-determining protein MreD
MQINRPGVGSFAFTIFFAMMLRIIPWPHTIQIFNPDWVLLSLIYWSLATPDRVGIFHSWIVGLLTDILTGSFMGQHALAYSISSFFCLKLHRRLRQYPILQQALFIFFTLLSSHLLIFWTTSLFSSIPFESSNSFLLEAIP